MVGSSTLHMSSVWANVEQWSWLGSHENEQKAYHNCGWAKSLLIVMNLARIRSFDSPCLESQGRFDCQVTPTYPANWPAVELWPVVDAYQLFNCLGKKISNEISQFFFLQQQIPCFALPPDFTVKMVFALIKALCATVKITAKTTAMKKAAKALKVGTGVLFCSAILYRLKLTQNRLSRKCDSTGLLCVG